MKSIPILFCTLALSTSTATLAASPRGPLIIDSIQYADTVDFPRAKTECALEQRFASSLQKQLRKQGYDVQLSDAAGADASAPRLSLTIQNIWAPGGGAWSGPKRVNVTGELHHQQQRLGSFAGQRSSTGGVFGGFKGTCSILNRDVDSLAKDIGRWIEQPSQEARLGEL